MRISKIRKLLNDKKWLKEKYKELIDETERWDTFHTFDCKDFFKGEVKAKYNREIYAKGIRKTENRLNFIKGLLDKTKVVDVNFKTIDEFNK